MVASRSLARVATFSRRAARTKADSRMRRVLSAPTPPTTSASRRATSFNDNPAFDAAAETLPITEFEPMLRRLFAQPRNTIYRAAVADQ